MMDETTNDGMSTEGMDQPVAPEAPAAPETPMPEAPAGDGTDTPENGEDTGM